MIYYTYKNDASFEIDDYLYEIVCQYSWHITEYGYIRTIVCPCDKNEFKKFGIFLHVLLFGKAPKGLEWDHKDRDKTNCKSSNLNLVTHSENNLNKDESSRIKTGISGVDGIHKNRNRWVVYLPPPLTPPGKPVFIGRFGNLEEAIVAQIKAINEIRS